MGDPKATGTDFEEIKYQIRDWYDKTSQKRFKRIKGYKVDRWLTITAMLLTFAWLLFVAYSYDFKLDYYECINGPGRAEFFMDGSQQDVWTSDSCLNPFYDPITWKNQKYLPPGEYGTKPGPLFNSVYYIHLFFFGLAFGLNHLFHNKKKNNFKGEINKDNTK